MANSTAIQILVDGPRNVVVKVTGILDTSDVAVTDLLDPSTLSDFNINGQKATQLAIKKIMYNVEDTLAINLYWDATTDVVIESLTGRGMIDAHKFGGLTNNAGAGKTGKIQYSTQGWAASAVLSFSVTLECVKQ